MTRYLTLGPAFVCLVFLSALTHAKEPLPTITLVLSGQDALLSKIEAIMVGIAKSPDQYATLRDLMGDFLLHTDPRSPLSWRTYLIDKQLRDIYTAQISSAKAFRDFRENLEVLGFTSRIDTKSARGENLFRMYGSDTGSIRYDARTKSVQVVLIGSTKDPALRQMSMELARTVTGPAPSSLLQGRDLVLLIQNDAGDLLERKGVISRLTETANTAIEKRLPHETDDEHNLRLAATREPLVQLERLIIESQRLTVGSTTSIQERRHTLDVELVPLPETSLARYVASLGKSSDEFANVASSGALITANINLPVDEMWQKSIRKMNTIWPVLFRNRTDARTDLSPESRQPENNLAELLTLVTSEVADSGIFNGFVRVYQNDKHFTTVGGVRVPDGMKILEALEKLAEQTNSDVKLKIERVNASATSTGVSPVAIHSISVPQAKRDFPEFFARDARIYIGTAERTVWYAFGEGALDVLRKAIQDSTLSGPRPSTNFVDAKLALHPFLRVWDRRQGTAGDAGLRRAVLEGLAAGNDVLSVRLWRDGTNSNLVHLEAIAELGILRAAGKIAAKAIRDNIEQ